MERRPGTRDWHVLTARVARGDREALGDFYELWFDRVFLAARRLTGRDEAFCLDVVQEVMLKVARKLRPMRTEDEVERWMAAVVRTTALDLLRRESRRTRRERVRAGVPGPDSPQRAAEKAEAAEWARAAVVSAPDAELLTRRIAREQTLEEIGAASGLSADAVHGRVRRTLHKLGHAARELFP